MGQHVIYHAIGQFRKQLSLGAATGGGHIDNNNNNNIHICIAPYGRNFRGAGPGSVLLGVRRGKRVSLGEEKCL